MSKTTDEHNPSVEKYWQRKLAAYLHDSPDKALDILDHEGRAKAMLKSFGVDEISRREADWAASAADRLPFPPSSKTKTELSVFKHPLGGSEFDANQDGHTAALANEKADRTLPKLIDNDPRSEFIAVWRLWKNWASSQARDMAMYPAETRLPDHTIWSHLAVTSAMQGCMGGSVKDFVAAKQANKEIEPTPDTPAFLLFTIGPVQDFIAAARSTRDLWSGSYLLSYLMGHVLRQVALDFGPDHVVFPNLIDIPMFDTLLDNDIWEKAFVSDAPLSEMFNHGNDSQRKLTPALPNRFLALLPSKMVEHQSRGTQFSSIESYARHLSESLREFLITEVGQSVCEAVKPVFKEFDDHKFQAQVEQMLEIHWQVLPWPDSFADVEKLVASLPADDKDAGYTPRAGLETVKNLSKHGADEKRYLNNGAPKLVSSGWSGLYTYAEWALDSVKSNRAFLSNQSGDATPGKRNTKDSLNGKEEAVIRIENRGDELSEKFRKTFDDHKGPKNDNIVNTPFLFKDGENLGASTLIKRLWPYSYLLKNHDLFPEDLSMPNTRSIANSMPWEKDDGRKDLMNQTGDTYFAVLALDGDEMGKWISGSKTPALEDVLSSECAQVYETDGADLSRGRPLSPSWHLQFSEALGNFAFHAASRIIEACNGRLIYAGGDDVLAMLPANRALHCAQALRMAFRGDPDLNGFVKGGLEAPLFEIKKPGFLQLTREATDRYGTANKYPTDDPVDFPAIVPGPNADCSVGISIAHFKSPLQDVVKAAQLAEKRAKNQMDRGAVAISLVKHSGEITEWGCKWGSGGLQLYNAIAERLDLKSLSNKFPHRVCELLEPYLTKRTGLVINSAAVEPFDPDTTKRVIEQEFQFAIDRQSPKHDDKDTNMKLLVPLLQDYLQQIESREQNKRADNRSESSISQQMLTELIGLCTTVAFAHRAKPENQK